MQGLSVDRDGEVLVLSLRGEIDFLNAPPIIQAIRQKLTQQSPARVRVDMSEVTFMDSSGIGVLVSAMRAAEGVSASFRVVHPSAGVLDQLDGVGLVEAFGLAGYQVDGPVDEPVEGSPAEG